MRHIHLLSKRSLAVRSLLAGAGLFLFLGFTGQVPAQGIPGYVVLPLSPIIRANQATVRATLNDQRTMLILDTGSPVTALDSRFYSGVRSQATEVDPLTLPPEVQKRINANGQAAQIGYVSDFRAGSMNFGKDHVLVTDLSAVFGHYNNLHGAGAIGGLLGEDLLRKYAAIIDWKRRGVYFNTDPSKRMKPGPGLIAAGWTAVPMTVTNGRHLLVSSTVSGKPVRLVVDTGAEFTTFVPGVVPLTVIYNRDTGASMARIASTTAQTSMINGEASIHPARVKHWKIGNYEIDSAVVATGGVPAGVLREQGPGDGPILGLLGAELLARHNAILDIGGSVLYLKPK